MPKKRSLGYARDDNLSSYKQAPGQLFMNWLDQCVIGIVGLSILYSMIRGFVREAISLAGWVVAFFVAKAYYLKAAHLFEGHIEAELGRVAAGWALLFLISLLSMGLIGILIGRLVSNAGLGATDRLLGVVFGGARGLLICAALVLGLEFFSPLPSNPAWKQSYFIPHIQVITGWFTEYAQQKFESKHTEPARQSSKAIRSRW